jgi:hypothetical protein
MIAINKPKSRLALCFFPPREALCVCSLSLGQGPPLVWSLFLVYVNTNHGGKKKKFFSLLCRSESVFKHNKQENHLPTLPTNVYNQSMSCMLPNNDWVVWIFVIFRLGILVVVPTLLLSPSTLPGDRHTNKRKHRVDDDDDEEQVGIGKSFFSSFASAETGS